MRRLPYLPCILNQPGFNHMWIWIYITLRYKTSLESRTKFKIFKSILRKIWNRSQSQRKVEERTLKPRLSKEEDVKLPVIVTLAWIVYHQLFVQETVKNSPLVCNQTLSSSSSDGASSQSTPEPPSSPSCSVLALLEGDLHLLAGL